MFRNRLKSGGAAALHLAGGASLMGHCTGRTKLPLVIGYHRVVRDFTAQARGYVPAMLISTAMLEKQLDWIGRRYAFADPDDMETWLSGHRPGGRPVAIITFDDGYRDVYDNAFPLLKRKGIPAVVFVVADLVGTDRLQLHDELYLLLSLALRQWPDPGRRMRQLLEAAGVGKPVSGLPLSGSATPQQWKRRLQATLPQAERQRIVRALRGEVTIPADMATSLQAMDWDMLARLHDAGVRIGSHTRRHALLTSEKPETIQDEIDGSRSMLQDRLGSKVRHFAYPDGRFNGPVVDAVAGAGYQFAYTTCRHRDDRFPALTIPRHLLWEKACVDPAGRFSSSVMACQVNGVFDYFSKCSMQHAA